MSLSEDELARAYRGIDGRPWPEEVPVAVSHESGLAPLESWRDLVHLASAQGGEHIYDVVILARTLPVAFDIPGVEFLGFDFGFYDDEYSRFSSIYHEALHSPLTELRAYAPRLNASLLLPTWADVEAYRATRASLLASGRDVERASECYPIAVFGEPKNSPARSR